MTVEIALGIVVAAGFMCYLVWKWQEAVVDMADPPYQEPVKTSQLNAEELNTHLNPKAAWPFPSGEKP